MSALAVGPVAAQTPGSSSQASSSQAASAQNTTTSDAETRPALPTFYGDTGLWFVPTAETLPHGKWSFSLFRANYDRAQGLTDVNQIGLTGAIGLGSRTEIFGSWRVVRLDRDIRPFFIPTDPLYGGVAQEYPYVRRGWSKTLGGPTYVGAKYNLISQSRGDAFSLAPRIMLKFPSGSSWASTNDWDYHIDLIGSREVAKSVEFTGTAGAVLRGDSDEFRVSDGVTWGVGAQFPTRSKLRGLVEWRGEFVIDQATQVINPPFIAEDGSIAPILSRLHDPVDFKIGAVWQATNGMFVHGGLNYSQGTSTRSVGGTEFDHNGWGLDVRFGWHPGTKVYVPPPPPEPVVREVVREVPAPPAPAPPPNRPPTFGVAITCDPCIVEPNQTSRLTASATDPDGDPVTYRWTAPQGTFNPATGANTTWTAPGQEGNVPVTVTAADNRGGSATNTLTIQVVRRVVLVFEDVHFDFDRFNLRPDALKILDDAVSKLQANPNVRITIEGHCDSIGTSEYNLALGERRASSVRDYLTNRGVMNTRTRTVSYGEDRPAADNSTAQGRAMNRRAHLVVIMETGAP